MAHALIDLMADRIAHGLRRSTASTPSKWAETYRIMSKPHPGPWTFKFHPWLREPHDTDSSVNVVMKAAQMGFTEWALNKTFYNIDIAGVDCLYILPSDGDAGDFSAGRFDPALESSQYLRSLFSNVRNVGHKRAGANNLYIRGSRSRSKLKSIPTGFIVFDEVDEMVQANIPLALERASGQIITQILYISTPTIEKDNFGIYGLFNSTTQEHFFFRCPHCKKMIELSLDNLKITAEDRHDTRLKDSFYFCGECKGVLDHGKKTDFLATGQYVPQFSDRDERGFTINQLYSCAKAGRPEEIALAVLIADEDPAKEQELYNSKLALPHTVAGARIQEDQIDKCVRNYKLGQVAKQGNFVHMGIDVGKTIYYEVDESIQTGKHEYMSRLLTCGTTLHFEELDTIMRDFGVHFAVVDRHPETRAAYQFALRFWGRVLLCVYGRGVTGRQLSAHNDNEKMITVDRTSWLDLSLGRFYNQTIQLPVNIPKEYREHIGHLVRHYEQDSQGNPIYRYVNIGPDHYGHARNYSELALAFAVGVGNYQDIKEWK